MFYQKPDSVFKRDPCLSLSATLSVQELLPMKSIGLMFCIFVSAVAYSAEENEVSEEARTVVAMIHLEKANDAMEAEDFSTAEHELSLAIISTPLNTRLYRARAQARFKLANYDGVVSDLDIYLEATPEDANYLLIRGLAKSLIKPEDVTGSCADFLKVEKSGVDLSMLNGIEVYCKDQNGWGDR